MFCGGGDDGMRRCDSRFGRESSSTVLKLRKIDVMLLDLQAAGWRAV